jgi:hypothetical protein
MKNRVFYSYGLLSAHCKDRSYKRVYVGSSQIGIHHHNDIDVNILYLFALVKNLDLKNKLVMPTAGTIYKQRTEQ